ncbi:hypothetical protein FQV39_18665 [Bosea sp. F3-2]|uniref:hypothetical protein n=1 Tax=Bosea sp. F3-2 TaxID=2599640 RepID=UPI0011EC4E77|nr:hypothetical protein [Bosea sp. F3-2]QEL24375.1 hypothetical protein FQV39_18665 [Bosea sp. F3-2]
MIDTSRTRFATLLALMIPAAVLGACTTQEAASPSEPQISVTSVPPQRSYLDPGPTPSRTGGPAYIQAGRNSFARQTDSFGNDLVPKIP